MLILSGLTLLPYFCFWFLTRGRLFDYLQTSVVWPQGARRSSLLVIKRWLCCSFMQTLSKLRLARNPFSETEQKAFEVVVLCYGTWTYLVGEKCSEEREGIRFSHPLAASDFHTQFGWWCHRTAVHNEADKLILFWLIGNLHQNNVWSFFTLICTKECTVAGISLLEWVLRMVVAQTGLGDTRWGIQSACSSQCGQSGQHLRDGVHESCKWLPPGMTRFMWAYWLVNISFWRFSSFQSPFFYSIFSSHPSVTLDEKSCHSWLGIWILVKVIVKVLTSVFRRRPKDIVPRLWIWRYAFVPFQRCLAAASLKERFDLNLVCSSSFLGLVKVF